jgi:hypothetical protein
MSRLAQAQVLQQEQVLVQVLALVRLRGLEPELRSRGQGLSQFCGQGFLLPSNQQLSGMNARWHVYED